MSLALLSCQTQGRLIFICSIHHQNRGTVLSLQVFRISSSAIPLWMKSMEIMYVPQKTELTWSVMVVNLQINSGYLNCWNLFLSHSFSPNYYLFKHQYVICTCQRNWLAFVIEKYQEWLVPCDPSTNHHNATERHHVGTGTWLLEHKMYMDWKKDPNSFMWIHVICE